MQSSNVVAGGSGTVGVELWSPGGDSGAAGDSVMRRRLRNAHSTSYALCVNAASARAATIGGDVCSFGSPHNVSRHWDFCCLPGALNCIQCSSSAGTRIGQHRHRSGSVVHACGHARCLACTARVCVQSSCTAHWSDSRRSRRRWKTFEAVRVHPKRRPSRLEMPISRSMRVRASDRECWRRMHAVWRVQCILNCTDVRLS